MYNKEVVKDLIIEGHEGLNEILSMMDKCVGGMERDVLNCDINTHSFSQLAVLKAKADGARMIVTKVRAELTKLKGDNKHGRD